VLLLGGISGAGITTILEDYRPTFMVVTFALLGSAFYLTYRPRRTTSQRSTSAAKMMTFNKIMLWVVTAIVIVFLFFPHAVTNLFASGDQFTPNMQRTVIQIEGMT
jgi:heme/copper-type cytochrome/quinol oxidase subunit 2